MRDLELRNRVRKEAQEEVRQAEEDEARITRRLRKWTYATIYLGIALSAAIVSTIPFSHEHSLHKQWDSVGKKLVDLSMGLFLAFMWTGTMAVAMLQYLKDTKQTNKRYLPPLGRRKTEKQ
jgi:transcription initiation factor TFIIIB Brf1 subunit/transcription initiation factor TFIIB